MLLGTFDASTSSEQIPSAKIISVDGIPSFVIYDVVYVPHTSDSTASENGYVASSTVIPLTVSVYASCPSNGAGTSISYVLSYSATDKS